MSTTEELLQKLISLGEEQLRWQRASVLPEVRHTIERALTTSQLRKAYEACDGSRLSKDLAKEAGASAQAFSDWTRRWRDLGIAFQNSEGRIQHLTSLRSLGLPLEISGSH